MLEFVRRIKKETKGAVTVFVTLLLIPALLVTGTGVDLASLFASRTMIRNANESALNALMSDYDQLLRDLYGLFAVTASNEEMQEIVRRYLALTLFGDDVYDEDGRFLYNNASIVGTEVRVANDGSHHADLLNRSILRRQIEEYVRIRAPLFFIDELLDRIEAFTHFFQDLAAVTHKMRITEQLVQLAELQRQLYFRIFTHDMYIPAPAWCPNNGFGFSNDMNVPLLYVDAYGRPIDSAGRPYEPPGYVHLMNPITGFLAIEALHANQLGHSILGFTWYVYELTRLREEYQALRVEWNNANATLQSAIQTVQNLENQISTLSNVHGTLNHVFQTLPIPPESNYDTARMRNDLTQARLRTNNIVSTQTQTQFKTAIDRAIDAIDDDASNIREEYIRTRNMIRDAVTAVANEHNDLLPYLSVAQNSRDIAAENESIARNNMNASRDHYANVHDNYFVPRLDETADLATYLSDNVRTAVNTGPVTNPALDRRNEVDIHRSERSGWGWDFWHAVVDFVEDPFGTERTEAVLEKERSSRLWAFDVQEYINNIGEIESIINLINAQAQAITNNLLTLNSRRHTWSRGLQNTLGPEVDNLLEEMGSLLNDSGGIVATHNQVYWHVANNSNTSNYFFRYANYLQNPHVLLGDLRFELNDIFYLVQSFQSPEATPDENLLTLITALTGVNYGEISFHVSPFFATEELRAINGQRSPLAFLGYTECDTIFRFFVTSFGEYGTETYFERRSSASFFSAEGGFFSNFISNMGDMAADMVNDVVQGVYFGGAGTNRIPPSVFELLRELDAMSAAGIPSCNEDSAEELSEFGSGEKEFGTTPLAILRNVIDMLDTVQALFRTIITDATSVAINQLALTSYAIGMFSCFTTHEEGVSLAGHAFDTDINFLLGWELEYLLIGSPNAMTNLLAFTGILFGVRLVFNFISSFTVPIVNTIVAPSKFQILRIIYVLGETFVDVFNLRRGESIPIIKVFNNQWWFGNPIAMKDTAVSIATDVGFGTLNAVINAIGQTIDPNNTSLLGSVLSDMDTYKWYKRGSMFASIATVAGSDEGMDAVFDSLENVFRDARDADALNNWTPFEPPETPETAEDILAEEIFNAAVGMLLPHASYVDYLKIMIFFTPSDTLTTRMSHLIALNMTNARHGSVNTSNLLRLNEAYTAFTLTTEVDLELQFMSSIMVQNRASDQVQQTLGRVPIRTVSNRGY